MIIMVCDGSGLDELSLVWQAVGRAVIPGSLLVITSVMIIMVCDGSGLDELSLVWQAVGRAVIRWTELAELKESGQSSFQCVIQFLRLAPYFIPQTFSLASKSGKPFFVHTSVVGPDLKDS
jgi:hypothetical protein